MISIINDQYYFSQVLLVFIRKALHFLCCILSCLWTSFFQLSKVFSTVNTRYVSVLLFKSDIFGRYNIHFTFNVWLSQIKLIKAKKKWYSCQKCNSSLAVLFITSWVISEIPDTITVKSTFRNFCRKKTFLSNPRD